ncbi:TPA: YchJ family protein [Klebsiella aerogenes]|nr:YchJ family protein [Klebsiella aerogenes]
MEAILSQLCPCGSALEYSSCCQRYLTGGQLAPSPSQLMRSRYSAFVMKDVDYLIKTWHPHCEAPRFRADIEKGFANTQWLGLTVFATDNGRSSDEGFVSFIARFTEDNRPGAIIERSRFLKENGQWYYIDGTRPLIGRNDPCPCGSGKKFKKCCGQQGPASAIANTTGFSPRCIHYNVKYYAPFALIRKASSRVSRIFVTNTS